MDDRVKPTSALVVLPGMADEKIGVPFREKATSVGLPSDSRILNRKPMSVAGRS